MARSRKATVPDVHAIASSLPEVERDPTDPHAARRVAYKVGGKTFVFFRGPRKDAFDPATGSLYEDVMAFHCTSEDKESMVGDPDSPWFTTPHWNGYNAVLLLERDLHRITVDELREVVTDAWLARAPRRLATQFLNGGTPPPTSGRQVARIAGPGAGPRPGPRPGPGPGPGQRAEDQP